jgi:enolase-phosphatase E1
VPPGSSVRAILLDIEGTTTPISFVYTRLFPYAREHLRAYLDAHGRSSEYENFSRLMDADSKTTQLKEVQGQIWEEGYRTGRLTGEVFDDVPTALKRWNDAGIAVGIFSSGSVLAQKLLFRHSSAGDLTPFLRWHFDTTIGAKKDAESYRRIASTLAVPADGVLFVSDVVPELDAARNAGMRTALSVRPENPPQGDHRHPVARSFDDLM